ncbi:MAG: hypothetical protein ACRD1C_11235, partial [Terriglobales bacterium]
AAGRVHAAGGGGLEGWRAAVRPLPVGAVVASAVRPNLPDAALVAAALRPLLESLDALSLPATLLLPDLTARLAVLRFDELPAKASELEPLARFRLRKSLPFAEEQALMSCQPLGGGRLLVAFADRARIAEYEDCLLAAGVRAAVVLPAGLACLASQPALDDAALLLRADSGCLTSAFCRQGRIEFFRALEIGDAPTFDDVFPSVAFFRDAVEGLPAAAQPGASVIFTAGLPGPVRAQLAAEAPWALLRSVEVPDATVPGESPEVLLAIAGALRGRFA